MSITDGTNIIFPNGSQFPECTGGNNSSTQLPFDITVLTANVGMTHISNKYYFTQAATSQITFQVLLRLDCALSNYIRNNGGNFFVNHEWFDDNLNSLSLVGCMAIEQTQIKYSQNLFPTSINIGYKETQTLIFNYDYVAGPAGADIALNWNIVNNCSSTLFTITTLEYFLNNGSANILQLNTVTPIALSGTSTGTLRIEATIVMNECAGSCANTDIAATLAYGCDASTYSPIIFCTQCDEIITTYINFENVEPTILYTRISPMDENSTINWANFLPEKALYEQPYDVSCPSNSLHWEYKITNPTNSKITAKHLRIIINEGSADNLTLMDGKGGLDPDFITTTNTNLHDFKTFTYNGLHTACKDQLFPTNAISGFEFQIEDLAPGETINIKFETRKCCTGDFSQFDYLFGIPKNYNRFYLDIQPQGICSPNQNIALKAVDANGAPDNIIFPGISTHWNNNGVPPDIEMKTTFMPTLSNIIVFPDNEYTSTNCSSVTALSIPNVITVNDLIGNITTVDEYDLQALGYQGLLDGSKKPDYINSPLLQNAYIRVAINCESGLQMDLLNQFSAYDPKYDFTPYFISGNIKWAPQFKIALQNNLNCDEEHTYLFFYRLGDLMADLNFLAGTKNPIDFIDNCAFKFNMFPCCELPLSHYVNGSNSGGYKIQFSLLGNCGTGNNPTAFNSGNYTDPSLCWLPLKKVEDDILINCPGCYGVGLITKAYYIRKKTMGYKDANNNQLADLNSSNATELIKYEPTIAKGKANYPNYDLMTHSIAAHGDELEDHFVSFLQDGDPTKGGYKYDEMICKQSFLRCLQILRKIPNAGGGMMDVNVTGFDFYIDDKNIANTDCADCDNFENYVGYTTKFEMHVNDITANGISSLFEWDGTTTNDASRNYLFSINDFDIASGKTNPNQFFAQANGNSTTYHNSFSNPYKYDVDERYRLVVRYRVCGNIVTDANGSNVITTAAIENDAYMIGTKLTFADALDPSNYPKMPNTKTESCWSPFNWAWTSACTFNSVCSNTSALPIGQKFCQCLQIQM
nr:hypothetical protein [Bacteroidota bacterium]